MTEPPDLNPAFLAMIEKGVSLIVSSAGPDLVPSVMRAVGSRVDDGGRRITAYLSRSQSTTLLRDIARSGRLAAVFSQPSTHLTLQLKSRRVRLREADASDAAPLAAYLRSMQDELAALGYPRDLATVMLAHRRDDLVAVEFQPDEAFDQTPGLRAGARVGAA